ncbi:zinc-ribbon domain-containing protein [Clostridium ganghwense]|uniref:Zinc-ribbon domain-containing protein n=1 Tax=Clostridium ganghwense TaxID=312089 RepID=A0ABT4CNL6_9CLOT|nr:zinc-ribbon domain-containing protein [Clostridium ganghwense]MCY6370033.1 zinc-ribbon domain-containing protein [Clostridium ganghwense]
MDFKNTLSKIRKTAIDTASSVAQSAKEGSSVIAKKSEELVEISKLTVSISSEESKLKDIYAEIGKQICEKYEHGIYIDPDLVENCNDIVKLKTNVKNMKDRIIQLKNKKFCPKCGEALESETVFCPKCGYSSENINITVEESNEAFEINEIQGNIADEETLPETEIIEEENKDTAF